MNASIPAEVIVSPPKEIQCCLVVNGMHLFKISHRSLLPVDQAGAIRLGSLSRQTPQCLLSPIIKSLHPFGGACLAKMASALDEDEAARPETVSRFEVFEDGKRAYVRSGVAIEVSYLDDDRTLKVFVKARKKAPT